MSEEIKKFSRQEGPSEDRHQLPNKEFAGLLVHFPASVQDAFKQLPVEIRDRILNRLSPPESTVESEFVRFMERAATEGRHQYHQWTEEEIRRMKPFQRELAASNVIYDFFRSIDVRSLMKSEDPGAKLEEVMDNLWNNRGKAEKDIRFYQQEYFDKIHAEYSELTEGKKKLIDEIKRISGKKSLNRPMRKRLEELERKLAKEFSLICYYGGDRLIFESSPFTGEKASALYKLELEFRNEDDEKRWQKTLTHLLEYRDAEDFAVLVYEQIDFQWKRWMDPEIYRKVDAAINKWAATHHSEGAMIKSEKVDRGENIQKLIGHFFRLFHSYITIKNIPATTKRQLENTVRELEVVLHMLKTRT